MQKSLPFNRLTGAVGSAAGLALISLTNPLPSYALGSCPGNEFPTPLGGCIVLTAGGFAEWFLNLGIGLGILITTLLLVVGGFGVATSAGNPENLEKAKETITSALAGLAFILLSWLILDIIGTDILGINIFNR